VSESEASTRGRVHLVFGPPGTGKTHYLTNQVRRVVEQHGPESLVVVSFSVTAAREISGRGLGLPDRAVGTLHSLAYRAIGHSLDVALDPKVLAGWNQDVGSEWRITPDNRRASAAAATEGGGGNTVMPASGDDLISSLDKARAMGEDPADYPPDLASFATAWHKWKDEVQAVDYTDMIELALELARAGEPAPGNPMVLVVDEGQDLTALEVQLVLAWGRLAKSVVIALDDDQAIMEWRGANPTLLLDLESQGFEVDRLVLDKSHRVPWAVHRIADRWVHRISARQEKVYKPRTVLEPLLHDGKPVVEEDGRPAMRDTGVKVEGAAYLVPQSLGSAELISEIDAELLATDRTIMVIASCTYMLDQMIRGLREAGIPYWNPLRPSEGRWNPFNAANGMSTAERVSRYLLPHEGMGERGRLWTGEDLRAFVPLLDVQKAGLRRGLKSSLDALPKGEISEQDFTALFPGLDEFDLDRVLSADPEWFAGALMASKAKLCAFPLQVVRKRGVLALADNPRVLIGTIHSVKGGVSDVVYVSPDLSAAGVGQLDSINGRDQMRRLFYVAVTRAREELRVLAPDNPRNFIKRADLLPPDLEVLPACPMAS
jgi:DNA helicase II / ATP-dependent DNA helicase PcrA